MRTWLEKYNLRNCLRVAMIFAILMSLSNALAWEGKYFMILAYAIVYYTVLSSVTAVGIELVDRSWHKGERRAAIAMGAVTYVVIVTLSFCQQEVILTYFSDYFSRREMIAVGIPTDDFLSATERVTLILVRVLLFGAIMGVTISNDNNKSRRHKAEATLERVLQSNLEIRMGQLRQQMAPHFLFNAFSTLSSMTKEPNAKRFISRLSDVYRYLLTHKDYSEEKIVTVEKEMNFVEAYLYILHERYEAGLEVVTEVSDKARKKMIPPFALQVAVENATKHNVITEETPLVIKIQSIDDTFIEIRNDIHEKRRKTESFGIGLYNIDEQYRLISGEGIECEKTDTEFIVRMKLL